MVHIHTETLQTEALPAVGFDGKRAAQNRTGLGNYSRFILRGLSRSRQIGKLLVYLPNPDRRDALDGVQDEAGITLRFPARCWHAFRALWRVWGVTHRLKADGVVLYHGLTGELPLNIRRARGVKSVVTIHDLIFLRYPRYYKPIDRWIYAYKFRRACRNADRIIAVSECTKRDIVRYFGTSADKIEVIYQGCDERFRQRVPKTILAAVRAHYHLPARYILYVGSIEERKNLILLARALALLSDTDIHVVAVGRHTVEAERIGAFLQVNGLDARFHMLNNVPVAHLPAFYQLAELFVYPSRFEGFGIPLLEALCSGTPAIGCTGSCLEEAGGPSSIYVHPDDAQALAGAIHRVLSDATLRARMIADGHDFAQRFEPARLTDQLLGCYRRVLGHAPAAHP